METRIGPNTILKKYNIIVRFPGVKIEIFEMMEGNIINVHQNVIVLNIEPELDMSMLN